MSTARLFKLAERFARKLSLGQDTSQNMEAPDFFFGKGYALGAFTKSLGNLSVAGNKAVGDVGLAKLMADFFNAGEGGNSVSVTVSVEVKPGQGARWITDIQPPTFVAKAMTELNARYQAVTGKSWVQGQVSAAQQAKSAKGVEGAGTVQIVDKGL
jgi:hypothetical protein